MEQLFPYLQDTLASSLLLQAVLVEGDHREAIWVRKRTIYENRGQAQDSACFLEVTIRAALKSEQCTWKKTETLPWLIVGCLRHTRMN